MWPVGDAHQPQQILQRCRLLNSYNSCTDTSTYTSNFVWNQVQSLFNHQNFKYNSKQQFPIFDDDKLIFNLLLPFTISPVSKCRSLLDPEVVKSSKLQISFKITSFIVLLMDMMILFQSQYGCEPCNFNLYLFVAFPSYYQSDCYCHLLNLY